MISRNFASWIQFPFYSLNIYPGHNLPERNPDLEGTEGSSVDSIGPSQEEWELWLDQHNKLNDEMEETKQTLLKLQQLVSIFLFLSAA